MLKIAGKPIQGSGKLIDFMKELLKEEKRPTRHQFPIDSVVDDGHPLGLGNAEILHAVFSHLSVSDLLNVRKVNLRWNYVACKFLQEKLAPCRIPPSRLTQFTKLMKKSCYNPFGSYAIRVENTRDPVVMKFFSDFKLDIVSLRMKIATEEIPVMIGILHTLTNLINLHIIRLPKEINYFRQKHKAESFWKYSTRQLLKLRTIKLEGENFLGKPVRIDESQDKCIVHIINACPNLKRVEFLKWDTPLSQIFQKCDMQNPKIFSGWRDDIDSKDLAQLFDSGLQFKIVRIIVDENDQRLSAWIKRQKPTLQSLFITNDKPRVFPTLCNNLSKVQALYLHRWTGPVSFPSLSKLFPSLNSLSLNSTVLEELKQPEYIIFGIVKTLRVLILMPTETSVSTVALEKLSQLFPRVNQLFVQLEGNDSAHVIYKVWPNLQVLFMDFKENVTDYAITGLQIKKSDITDYFQCGCPNTGFTDRERKLNPSIKDLKCLLILVVRCGEGLTSLSLLEGICKLKSLQRLWLLPNPDVEFNYRWCVNAIADTLSELQQLVLARQANYSPESITYLKEKLPFVHLQFK